MHQQRASTSAVSTRLAKLVFSLTMAASLLACGGGDGGKPAAAVNMPPPSTAAGLQSGVLTGTTATGAAWVGALVSVKDANGQVFLAAAPTDAQGSYRVNLTKAQAPYLIQARSSSPGNPVTLYSLATADDLNRTINISQLSNLLVANLAGGDPNLAWGTSQHKGITRGQVDTALANLQAKLRPLLETSGVDMASVLRTAFAPDHTGTDLLLDLLVVNIDHGSGVAEITNTLGGDTVRDLLNPQGADDSAQLPVRDPEAVRELFAPAPGALSRVQQAQDLVRQLNTALLEGGGQAGHASLTALCDANDFLDSLSTSCADWAAKLAADTSNGSIPLALRRVVAFDTQEAHNTHATKTAEKRIDDTNFGALITPVRDNRLSEKLAVALHKSGNAWKIGGDRRLVNVAVRGFATSSHYITGSPVALKRALAKEAGVQVRAHSAHLDQATSVRIEGYGMGHDHDRSGWLDLYSAPTVKTLGAPLNQDPVNTVFVVRVVKEDVEVASYKSYMQSSRMPTNAAVDQEVFPSIRKTIAISECATGNVGTRWGLPAGQLAVYTAMYCSGSGNDEYGMVERDLRGLEMVSEGHDDTTGRRVAKPDTSAVTLQTVDADGVLYIVTQDTILAARGIELKSGFEGETHRSFVSDRQGTLDYLNTYFPTVAFQTMGEDGLLTAICRTGGAQPGYMWSLVTAPEAQVRAVTEVTELAGKQFSAFKCQRSTAGHALTINAAGEVTLSSTEQSAASALQTQTFSQAASQALLTGQAGSTSSDGIRTWLHPFQVIWEGVTSWFVMETDQTPDNRLWTTIWRELTT